MNQDNVKILVVDDDPVSLKMLEKSLCNEGYQVLTATDGPPARKLASQEHPDLIILDIMMPEEDGFQVMDRLKKNSDTAGIPVIFLTGRDELDTKLKGFDLGAVDYITKPFYGQEMLARVRLHLKLSMATNSLVASQAAKLKQIQDAQHAMLVSPRDLPDAQFAVKYLPFLEAGGDFYDVLSISDSIFGYFVADVSGHDLATSYITAAVKGLLRQNCTPFYKPVETVEMMNNVLVEILTDGKYLTGCYCRLNRKAGVMTVVNAGHLPVVHVPAAGSAALIEMDGDVLGAFQNVAYGSQDIRVQPGDRFYLYTDGLVERPGEKRVWSQALSRLTETAATMKDRSIEEATQGLFDTMLADTPRPEDDVVVLGIQV
ncbi:MAG: fused response regulator/phosphatase [Deltaproteobacteria bacterium]|nr:fused response regulator/phosphatase [Deltaproteobacteria bacterium]